MRLQVIQKTAALADQHQQTTPRSVILLVCLEVLGQFANPLTQNRDLDLRRTGVRIVGAEAFNQGQFSLQSPARRVLLLLRSQSTLKCLM